MRIVIDLQACQTPSSRNRGIGRYSMALAQAMARLSGSHDFWLVLNSRFPETVEPIHKAFDRIIPSERICLFNLPSTLSKINSESGWRKKADEYIREFAVASLKPDFHHLTSLFEGEDAATSVNKLNLRVPTAVTLYDLIPLIKQDHYLQDRRVRAWYYRKLESLKKANLLLSISDYSRREALSALDLPGERVVNISAAIDSHFQPVSLTATQTQALQVRYGLSRPFVMYTGGIDYRKNIEGLIQAYAQLPPETRQAYQLAIVCSVSPEDKTRLVALAQAQGLTSNEIVFTGYVPDGDLVLLYNLCHLFVFPSLYEGFGLPALEAMACGAAVIASDSSSIPEVIGRQDALFDPTDPASITQALYHALTDEEFRQSLRDHAPKQAAKFSWQASAQRALEAFEALHDQQRHTQQIAVTVPSHRPRLAYVSPLPPEQSGIADYSAELLPELARFYDITLVVNQPSVEDAWLTANLPVKDVAWFKAHAGHFDRILYHFGNSAFHAHMFELLENYPGVVDLHDFYLSGVIDWMDTTNLVAQSHSFRSRLYYSHGYLGLLALQEKGTEFTIWTYPCNKTVLDQATGIIFHSHYALESVYRWYDIVPTRDWPVIPYPKCSPNDLTRELSRNKLNLDSNDFLVVSLGEIGSSNWSHRLVDVWLNSPFVQDKHCYLVSLKQNGEKCQDDELLSKIQGQKPKTQAYTVNFTSSEVYRCYLEAADVAVQLVTPSREETSETILDALAYGVPVITNARLSVEKYPEALLIKLSDDFSNEELINHLNMVRGNSLFQQPLNKSERNHITIYHSPEKIACQYYNYIENIDTQSLFSFHRKTLEILGDLYKAAQADEKDLRTAAMAIASNSPVARHKQLMIDISKLVKRKNILSNQNLVCKTLFKVLNCPSSKYRIEPVYWDKKSYRYARSFISLLINESVLLVEDDTIDFYGEDIFLGCNFDTSTVCQWDNRNVFCFSSKNLLKIADLIKTRINSSEGKHKSDDLSWLTWQLDLKVLMETMLTQ